MLAEERKVRIVELVNAHGAASLSELSTLLGASESTIRRDIAALAEAGRVMRVHGGATRVTSTDLVLVDQSFPERAVLNAPEKELIGAFAAALIGPDDFVFIDGGTTAAALVRHLCEKRATYLTNSLPIAQNLMQLGFKTLIPAGEIKPITEAIVGESAIESISRFNFTIGFFGTNGADARTGFTTPEIAEAAIKRAALGRTLHSFIICDSSKFSKTSLVTFAEFSDASIICDSAPDEAKNAMMLAQLHAPAIELVEVA